jgi:hypothetical protein
MPIPVTAWNAASTSAAVVELWRGSQNPGPEPSGKSARIL